MIIRAICILLLPGFIACGDGRPAEGENVMEPVETENVNEFVREPVEYNETDSSRAARLTFEETIIDFDSVPEGEVVVREYKFENTGKSPVMIADVFSSCGCTVPSWPDESIGPGERGSIRVRFNSEDRPGVQDKPVTVISNAIPRRYELRLRGYVKPANKKD